MFYTIYSLCCLQEMNKKGTRVKTESPVRKQSQNTIVEAQTKLIPLAMDEWAGWKTFWKQKIQDLQLGGLQKGIKDDFQVFDLKN